MSPPNQTDLPAEATAQEAQRVWFLSHRVRAEVCWQGRQEIRAVITSVLEDGLDGPALKGVLEDADTDF